MMSNNYTGMGRLLTEAGEHWDRIVSNMEPGASISISGFYVDNHLDEEYCRQIRRLGSVHFAQKLQTIHDQLLQTPSEKLMAWMDGIKDPLVIVDMIWKKAKEDEERKRARKG